MKDGFPIDRLDWQKGDGLVPAIVQHAADGRVLMLAYMNREALEKTLASGKVSFYSRSRQSLWTKGETSGNSLILQSLAVDCDFDTLLVQALPLGPVCHTGTDTCFGNRRHPPTGFLATMQALIESRRSADPDSSYTARLLGAGIGRCAQKLGEEGVEVALAAVAGQRDPLLEESADLLYHLLVVLAAADTSVDEVCRVLERRRSLPNPGPVDT